MFQEEVTLTFIFQTIAVILALTAIGIYLVKKKARGIK
jgi:hypothetical protein